MGKELQVEFDTDRGPGVLDLAIRLDVERGSYEFIVEENGVPTTIPYHTFIGILQLMQHHAAERFYRPKD